MQKLIYSEPSNTFKARYCERFSVPPEHFDKSLFWKTTRWYVSPFVLVVRVVHARYFRMDDEFIRSVGSCESVADIRAEIAAFHWECGISSPLRRHLKVRVSTSRVVRLAKRLLRNDSLATADV